MNGNRRPTRPSSSGKSKSALPRRGADGRLPGVHKVTSRGRTYYYAWRGGPPLPDPALDGPGHAAAYAAAHAARRDTREPQTLADLVEVYRHSPEFLTKLAPSTRAIRALRLAAIAKHRIGRLPILALEARQAARVLIAYRNEMAATPRAADEHIETISVVCNHALLLGYLTRNPAARVPALYQRGGHKAARWRQQDLEAFAIHASAPVRQALALACLTGLRRGDLCSLDWSQVDLQRGLIRRPTGKSSGRTVAFIPLDPAARTLLDDLPHRTGPVLRPDPTRPEGWTTHALTRAVHAAAKAAGLNLRLHDARGTYATLLFAAGLTNDEIELRMGWEKDQARARRLDYVDEQEVATQLAKRLERFTAESEPLETKAD